MLTKKKKKSIYNIFNFRCDKKNQLLELEIAKIFMLWEFLYIFGGTDALKFWKVC